MSGLIVDPGATEIKATVGIFGAAALGLPPLLLSAATKVVGGVIAAGQSEVIYSGGVVSATTVLGSQLIDGGLAIGCVVSIGAGQDVVSGVASATVIASGGFDFVEFGSSVAADILAGGTQTVEVGTAISTVIGSGGQQLVRQESVVAGAVVQSGGMQILSSLREYIDTITQRTVIERGGEEVLSAYGLASGTVISAGGMLVIGAGTATNTVLLQGGTIDLQTLAYVSGGTATLNVATDLLTIQEGSKTTTLQLQGSYAGEQFDLSRDAGHGTLVTLSAGMAARAAAYPELLPGAAVTPAPVHGPVEGAPAAQLQHDAPTIEPLLVAQHS